MMVESEELRLKEALLLLILEREGPIGRYRLTPMLNISEGRVKGMLRRMRDKGYLKAGKAGCRITDEGKRKLKEWLRSRNILNIREIDASPLKVGPKSILIHVHGKAHRIRMGVEQRDVAVRAGALGAVNMVFKAGVLSIPPIYPNLEEALPNFTKEIVQTFKPRDGDVLIITFSENLYKSLEASLSVAEFLS